jgi:hypothetical protein
MSLGEEASQREIQARLLQKFSKIRLDAIVAVGPEPIRFLSGSSTTLFPEVPVVFCGSIEAVAGRPKLDSRFTGSWLKLEPAKTIDAALQLLPQTQNIVIVGGTSAFDRANETLTREKLRSYEARFAFTYLTDLRMSDLLEHLRRLHPSTLQSLGLVPGVSAFCREFAAQQSIQVDFSHQDIPRSVPPEAALCVFYCSGVGPR